MNQESYFQSKINNGFKKTDKSVTYKTINKSVKLESGIFANANKTNSPNIKTLIEKKLGKAIKTINDSWTKSSCLYVQKILVFPMKKLKQNHMKLFLVKLDKSIETSSLEILSNSKKDGKRMLALSGLEAQFSNFSKTKEKFYYRKTVIEKASKH